MDTVVIFDFDGVITDSEPLHHRAFQRVLDSEGIGLSWEEYLRHWIGFDDRDVFRGLWARTGRQLRPEKLHELIQRKADAVVQLAAESPPPLYEGVSDLLRALRPRAVIALCTGALASDIRAILQSERLQELFHVIVTADDVTASKPDPSGYRLAHQRAAALLGRRPDTVRGVAVEDTPAGIESAHGAHLPVVAVATTHSPEDLGGADLVVRSLTCLSVDQLLELARVP